MTKEVMQQALEALEKTQVEGYNLPGTSIREAITALREALAQPMQEPVARVAEVHMSRYTLEWTNGPLPEGTELFSALPVQRQPLTEKEMLDISGDALASTGLPFYIRFTRAIEAAHNIGGAKP